MDKIGSLGIPKSVIKLRNQLLVRQQVKELSWRHYVMKKAINLEEWK